MFKFSIGFLIAFLSTIGLVYNQEGKIIVDIEKLSQDSLQNYSVAILNNSDSVLCFVHSPYISLNTPNAQVLSPITQNASTEDYTIRHSIEDDYIDPAIAIYRGVCILPYQAKIFSIAVPLSIKKQRIGFDFFYRNDYSHNSFIKEMQKRGWYRKYNTFVVSKLLPE